MHNMCSSAFISVYYVLCLSFKFSFSICAEHWWWILYLWWSHTMQKSLHKKKCNPLHFCLLHFSEKLWNSQFYTFMMQQSKRNHLDLCRGFILLGSPIRILDGKIKIWKYVKYRTFTFYINCMQFSQFNLTSCLVVAPLTVASVGRHGWINLIACLTLQGEDIVPLCLVAAVFDWLWPTGEGQDSIIPVF